MTKNNSKLKGAYAIVQTIGIDLEILEQTEYFQLFLNSQNTEYEGQRPYGYQSCQEKF